MSGYQDAIDSFFAKNMTEDVKGMSILVFPIYLAWHLSMAVVRVGLILLYLAIGVLTLGKVDLNRAYSEKQARKKQEEEENKVYYYDPLVYLPVKNKYNLKELKSIRNEIEEYFDEELGGSEQIMFAVSHKKMAAFFTTERILYKLESAKKTSFDMVFGIVNNSDVKSVEFKKTFTDGLDFVINGEKVAHLGSQSADADDVDLKRLDRLCLIVNQRINK